MYELSLFSGSGGGLLGTYLLGWTPVGYVEIDDYCQRVIAQRIEDGILPGAPIFSDVRTFASEGYTASYTGLVDVITAGFPCQPFSTAGKQQGADDKRNMWPATIDVIRIVKPNLLLLENVPGIISNGYIFTILNDLAKAGYQTLPPLRVGADDVGANHRRKRIWIVAYATSSSYTIHKCKSKTFIPKRTNALGSSWWKTEPGIPRMDDGYANRMDIDRAIGQAQVPAVVATVWQLLTNAPISPPKP